MIRYFLLLFVLIIAGCGKKSAETTGKSVTYVDVLLRKVEIPASPKRIVCIATADAEILSVLGCDSIIAGVPDSQKEPASLKDKPKIGGMYAKLSPERVVGIKPDLVIVTMSDWDKNRNHVDDIARFGIPTIALKGTTDFVSLASHIRELGKIVGKKELADSLAESTLARVELVKKESTPAVDSLRPKVYIEWATKTAKKTTYGKGDRYTDLIDLAGGKNIFADVNQRYFEPPVEKILTLNPEIIIASVDLSVMDTASYRKELCSRPGWDLLDAVKNGRIYFIEASETWGNPRTISSLENLAKIIKTNELPK